MKRTVLVSPAALLCLALAACAGPSGGETAEPAPSETVAASDDGGAEGASGEAGASDGGGEGPASGNGSEDGTAGSGHAAGAADSGDVPEDAVTVIHQDDRKSVLRVDADGLAALTGIEVEEDTLEDLRTRLADEATWDGHELTADDAGLIAGAITRESGSTTGALKAVANDPNAAMKVVVLRTPHHTDAHIQVDRRG